MLYDYLSYLYVKLFFVPVLNYSAFLSNLQLFDWNSVYAADDADTAYNSFFCCHNFCIW